MKTINAKSGSHLKIKTRNIYLMYAIGLLQGMVFYGPVATLYREARGVSVFQITVIESISLALCLLLEFPWGILADKIGYKKTILICNFLYFFSKLVFWKADSFGYFLLERIMISIVIAGLSGVDTALLYLSCEEEQNGACQEHSLQGKSHQVFSIYNSLQTAGLLFAAFLFSKTPQMTAGGYSLSAFLTVISYGLAALFSLGLSDVKRKEEPHRFPDFIFLLKQMLTDKYLLLFLISVALLNESHQTITVFLSQLQYVKCGLSDSSIGYIYIAATIAGLCGALSAQITKKLGMPCTASLLFFSASGACLILALTGSAWLSISGILTLRIAFSLFQPLQSELQNRQVSTADRATALSIQAVIIDSVGIGTNIAFGSLAQQGLAYALLLGAFLCLAGGFFFRLWYRKRGQSKNP